MLIGTYRRTNLAGLLYGDGQLIQKSQLQQMLAWLKGVLCRSEQPNVACATQQARWARGRAAHNIG